MAYEVALTKDAERDLEDISLQRLQADGTAAAARSRVMRASGGGCE
jgi:hypothetical protein